MPTTIRIKTIRRIVPSIRSTSGRLQEHVSCQPAAAPEVRARTREGVPYNQWQDLHRRWIGGRSREAGTATRLARRLLDPPRMDFTLKPLPYSKNALEPALGRETVTLHYEKHHAGYLHKLKKLLDDKPEASESLEWIICASDGPVFDNAAQAWNHDFYWRSMHPDGGGNPSGELASA